LLLLLLIIKFPIQNQLKINLMKVRNLFKKFNNQKFSHNVKKPFQHYREALLSSGFIVTPARDVDNKIERPAYAYHTVERQEFYQSEGHSKCSIITDPEELKKFKKAAQIAAGAVERAVATVKEGISTDDIDKVVHDYIVSQGAYPSAINYMGFPKSVCTSVNEVACHGIPNSRKLIKGDFLNIDVTAYYAGYHGDTSAMATAGGVHEDIKELIEVTRLSMFKAISICKPGEKIATIGKVIEEYVESKGFTVCKEFCGHGVGNYMHMLPLVSHHNNDSEYIMKPGMTFTIEPIVMMYPYKQLYMWEDNWTVIAPYNPSAQWEHIIYITGTNHEILTLRENEQIPLI
jgi:methionyl aminopeptidase